MTQENGPRCYSLWSCALHELYEGVTLIEGGSWESRLPWGSENITNGEWFPHDFGRLSIHKFWLQAIEIITNLGQIQIYWKATVIAQHLEEVIMTKSGD